MKNYTKFIIVLFAIFLFIQCGGSKSTMGSSKTKRSLVKEFFVGSEGTQYFINPLSFDSEDGNSELLLDITFKYKDEIKDSAIVNFTVMDAQIIKKLNVLKIENSKVKSEAEKLNLLFNEVDKKNYNSRFTCKILVEEINQLFMDGNWHLQISNDEFNKTFTPSKSSLKAIEGVQQQVFILMN